ncbi:carboxymuconolactone decarboxylase family protein [Cupriavidus basilensis]
MGRHGVSGAGLDRAVYAHGQLSTELPALDSRTFELVCIAIDASVTHMFAPGTRRHIRRALDLGVSADEIVAVLQLTATLGLHTMSMAAPLLQQELRERQATANEPA